MIPTFFVVTGVVFFLLQVAPGDAVDLILSESSPSQAERDRRRAELNLDKPEYIQYGLWLGKMVTGDFGTSMLRNAKVSSLVKERVPNSIRLGFMALVFGWMIAVPVGIISAVKVDTWIDYVARSLAVLMLSIPNFWVALMVIFVPALLFGVTPPLTYIPFDIDPFGNVVFFIIPALVLGVALTGTEMRMTRAMMLEVISQDYIRTARAKGLPERRVILGHALKNALIPVVTIMGTQTATLVGGVVIIEQIFGVPGMGQLLFQSITTKDFPVVQGVTTILSIFILAANLLVDLSYAWLDPRIKWS